MCRALAGSCSQVHVREIGASRSGRLIDLVEIGDGDRSANLAARVPPASRPLQRARSNFAMGTRPKYWNQAKSVRAAAQLNLPSHKMASRWLG